MSSSAMTPMPSTVTLNLGNGYSTTSTYNYNSFDLPSGVVIDTYQNGVLTNEDNETFIFNKNGTETVNWTDTNKTLNTSSSGTSTMPI